MLRLHMGHRSDICSHSSTQGTWNMWPHGSRLHSSPWLKSCRQMAHSLCTARDGDAAAWTKLLSTSSTSSSSECCEDASKRQRSKRGSKGKSTERELNAYRAVDAG